MDTAFDAYFAEYDEVFDGDKEDGILFADATLEDKADPARVITYKTNAKGQIRAFAKADSTALFLNDDDGVAVEEYTEKSQIITGVDADDAEGMATLEDEIVIFNVMGDEAEDAYVTDLSYLVDEGKYAGTALANAKGEYDAMIITLGSSVFNKEDGIAIVTKVSYTKNAEDDDVVKVSVIKNSEEATITFDDDSTAKGGIDIDDDNFGIGSVIAYNASAAGVVSEYVVLATVEDGALVENDGAYYLVMDDTKDSFIVGDINNDEPKDNKNGEVLTVGSSIVVVPEDANMYTYDASGKKVVIEVGDFMSSKDMGYYDEDEGATSMVFVRVVDGAVVDIYGFAK